MAIAAAFIASAATTGLAEAGTLPGASGSAQAVREPRGAWNGVVVRDLMQRAITRRVGSTREGGLEDYRARASGHIYFLYDLGSGTERHLVKADQLALQLYWKAPDQTRQVIVGRREAKSLPTNIRYHLDHLTVVMDNLGERIRLGEGSEVREVLHPAAAGALDYYDYRLADSLVLILPEREVRVYKVEVRPSDLRLPGLVGAIYLDRRSADIVRLECTFTTSSYLDSSLDYINIRLENALWEGGYWLPHRQGIELRREIELLDFPAGGIIRAEFKIGDYQFNTSIPQAFFRGSRVTSLPARMREGFEFEEDLYAALDPQRAAAPPSLEEIRGHATRLVGESYLRRLQSLQLSVPGASSLLRFRRAEGAYLGPGFSRGLGGGANLRVLGGYALGRDRWQLEGQIAVPLRGGLDVTVAGYVERAADASVWTPSSGVISTLAALIDGEDYREPYWASGGRLRLGGTRGALRTGVSIAWERWESAALEAASVLDRSFRIVRQLDEGEVGWLALTFERPPIGAVEAVGGMNWGVWLEGASHELVGDFEFVRFAVRGEQYWPEIFPGLSLRASGAGGGVWGSRVPAQRLFAVGGRGTARGYGFHAFAGNLFSAVSFELARQVFHPLLSFALFTDLAWVGNEGRGAARALSVWNVRGRVASSTRGPLVGVGAGLGILFDILRVDLARGLREGGIWELVVRVRPEFWSWL